MTTNVSVSGERNTFETIPYLQLISGTLTALVVYCFQYERRKRFGLLRVNRQIYMEGAPIFWSSNRLLFKDEREFNQVVGGLSPWLRACIRDVRINPNMRYRVLYVPRPRYNKREVVEGMYQILSHCTSLRVLHVHETEKDRWATRNTARLAAAAPHLDSLTITIVGARLHYSYGARRFKEVNHRRVLSLLADYQDFGDEDGFWASAEIFATPADFVKAAKRAGLCLFHEREPEALTLHNGKQVTMTLLIVCDPILLLARLGSRIILPLIFRSLSPGRLTDETNETENEDTG